MSELLHLPLQMYSKQLLELFQQAITQKDPAYFLYKKNARTPLFKLESLLRILSKTFNDKDIEKNRLKIKKLEDCLGRIDDYDALLKLFQKNNSVKKEEVNYFEYKRNKALEKLNKELRKKEFYQDLFNRLNTKFKIDFNEKELMLKLEDDLKREMKECFNFFSEFPSRFDSMEGEVHELRRKLRWLSIYGESLQGLIVLKDNLKKYTWEKFFITKAEIDSKYNKLPVNKKLKRHIEFNKKVFLAISFVITKLGRIKDEGLAMEALIKSVRKTSDMDSSEATDLVIKQLKPKYSQEQLLAEAHALLTDFFVKYKIHELLILKKQ